MKKRYFSLIIVILLTILSLITLNKLFWTDSPEKLLINAFKSSGAVIVSSEVYFKGKIDWIGSENIKKLEEIGTELAYGLGCSKDKLNVKTINNDELEGVEISGTSGSNLSIAISAILSKNSMEYDKSYITASVIDKDGVQDIDILKSKADTVLGRYGVKSTVNSCLIGSYKGKLGNNQLNEICAKVFNSADAKKVEGISENNLISISAYAPSIGQAIEVNGQKVNLNIAIRYNSYEHKTYIWLATPVIITEY